MHIVASFEYSTTLELALNKLEENGIKKGDIVVIPLDKREEESMVLDTLHHSDGKSLIDIAAILGTIFMLLGTIYGFILEWGPIIWGLIGLLAGALLGFFIDFFYTRKRNKMGKVTKEKTSEVIMTIKCHNNERKVIESILWEHNALGVGRVGEKT
ncbi:hypothetical protein J2S74_000040 [Evansella vedderi]|uniref:Uncharacterized protein n=1 Tax=Evansella vedderi TaxID=38282 RepID=A0ABT9ZQE8_9BACI|nr:hypothetical protein [Evansella vedderi]MDQ0252668.1 hypothetical protein [Evansella vedderi]